MLLGSSGSGGATSSYDFCDILLDFLVTKLKDLDAETEVELEKPDLIGAIKEKLAVMGDRRIVFAKSST